MEQTAASSRRTVLGYDSTENTWPALVTNALDQTELHTYHPAFGVLVASQDPNNVLTTKQIDGFGRLRTERPADGSTTEFSYQQSPQGNFVSLGARTHGGQSTMSIIDPYGRETRRVHLSLKGEPELVDRGYDSAGKLSTLSTPHPYSSSPAGWTFFQYDALGRLRKVQRVPGRWC